MSDNNVDLVSLFQTVTQALAENQNALNNADEYNQDHGSNMVQTFQTITSALEKKKGSSDSAALAYASKQLAHSQTSGSGQLYAENLARAAGQFKNEPVDYQGALQLLQTLIGAGQVNAVPAQPSLPAQDSGGDMLSMLMGGLGAGQEPAATQPSAAGGDLLSMLLGGSTQAQNSAEAESSTPQGQSGFGLDDLLNAGLAFMQAKQSGGNNMQALVQAFLSASGMGSASHRTQSTQIVINTFLQALNSFQNQATP
jgi:hypothetical protein